MKKFTCDCGNIIHFENVTCLGCGRVLGFLPDVQEMSAFESGDGKVWRALHPDAHDRVYRKCRNYEKEDVCNWMVYAEEPNDCCISCRLTRVIPNLSRPENRKLWFRIEKAKRRMLYTVLFLGLPLTGREEDRQTGLAFDFLEDEVFGEEDGPGKSRKVMTGHDRGVITINLSEADPSAREEIREMMQERYRTLLGHFRHEIAHYYWDRLVWKTTLIEEYRGYFGDERQNYQQALDRHYKEGAPADWKRSFISAYASMHPWEDWAETWSHYMHIVDTLETAHEWGFGLGGRQVPHPVSSRRDEMVYTTFAHKPSFSELINDWINLTLVLNELNRSMGMPDPYPFTLSERVVEKLHFVHDVIRSAVK